MNEREKEILELDKLSRRSGFWNGLVIGFVGGVLICVLAYYFSST